MTPSAVATWLFTLLDHCKLWSKYRHDPSRPATAGFHCTDDAIASGLAAEVDVQGWNYRPDTYSRYHREHPGWTMYASETGSCVSSRGEYFLPARKAFASESAEKPWHLEFQCSSYDLETRKTLPDDEFAAQDDNPSILGEFVWTGFDYLGEASPYRTQWPRVSDDHFVRRSPFSK